MKNSSLGYIVVGYWTTHGYTNSRIANSQTGRLADWTTRGCLGSSSCSFNAWDFKLLAWEREMDPECI